MLTDMGMQSGISKQQVVRCASFISMSEHQHQSAPNMTIPDKKTHITWYIKVKVNIPGWGTSVLLGTQHSDIFRIAAVICVYWKPWWIQTYPFKPSMHR